MLKTKVVILRKCAAKQKSISFDYMKYVNAEGEEPSRILLFIRFTATIFIRVKTHHKTKSEIRMWSIGIFLYVYPKMVTITPNAKRVKRRQKQSSEKKQTKTRTLTYSERPRSMLKRLFCVLSFISSANTHGCCSVVYLSGALNVNVHRIHDEMNE